MHQESVTHHEDEWSVEFQIATFRKLFNTTAIPHCVSVVCNHRTGEIWFVCTVSTEPLFIFTISFFIKEDLLVKHWSLEYSHILLNLYPGRLEKAYAETFDYVVSLEDETHLECLRGQTRAARQQQSKQLGVIHRLASPTIPYRDLLCGKRELGMIQGQSFRRAVITCSHTTLLSPHTYNGIQ